MTLFRDLSDAQAQHLGGGQSDLPPGLDQQGKIPAGLDKQEKTPGGWAQGNAQWKLMPTI